MCVFCFRSHMQNSGYRVYIIIRTLMTTTRFTRETTPRLSLEMEDAVEKRTRTEYASTHDERRELIPDARQAERLDYACGTGNGVDLADRYHT